MEVDYATIFEKMVEDSGRHNVRPAKLSEISQVILIMMIGQVSMTADLAQKNGKTTREISARLFRLKKSGYVKKGSAGWKLTVLGEALAKYFMGVKNKEYSVKQLIQNSKSDII